MAIVINPAASERDLLVQLLLLLDKNHTIVTERLISMSQIATDTDAKVAELDAKVDTLIAAVTPSIQTLRDQLAAAQAQVATLQAGDASDLATLQGTLAAASTEVGKVDAAIAALTPTPGP
jgi:phage I-like protein